MVKQSVRKGVIGEKMVWARAEPWAHLQKRPASWTHLVSTGLYGWCPSYHMRLNQIRSSCKKAFPECWASQESSLDSMYRVCSMLTFLLSLQWKENNGDICIVTRNEGPWHTGLGKHPAIDPAAQWRSCRLESTPPPIRRSVLQASLIMEVLSHCWLSRWVQHFP